MRVPFGYSHHRYNGRDNDVGQFLADSVWSVRESLSGILAGCADLGGNYLAVFFADLGDSRPY